MRQAFTKIIDAGNAATSPLNSAKIDARQVYALSAIITSSDGTNAGTLKLQGSNDICAFGNMAIPDFTPTNWADITSATVTVAAGAIGYIAITQVCFAWIRAVWTPSAGAGTITVTVNSQGF
jgi:hypothetical protein